MITTYASGSQACTVTTEHDLSAPNVQGTYRLTLDLNALVAGDVLEVRAYKMTVAGGTSRAHLFTAYYGAQDSFKLIAEPFDPITNSLTDTNAIRYTIKQTFGTSRTIPWRVDKDDALTPTTTARTLDVTATGAAGIDWANVENPTTALNLSATNIDVDQIVASVSGAVGSVTGAVGSVTGAVGSVTGAVGSVTGAVGSVTGNVGGNVTGSVGSVAAGGITASSIADSAIDRATFAIDTGLRSVRSNTAQSATATTIVLDAAASAVNDFYNNSVIYITGGTGVGQARSITDYVGATVTATVDTWATTPDNTSTFAIMADSASSGGGGGATAADVWSYTTRTLTSTGNVQVVSPVALGGNVSVYAGYDYYSTDSRALQWSSTAWPDLTSATVRLHRTDDAATTLGFTMSVSGAGGATQTVVAEGSNTVTSALADLAEAPNIPFRITATLSTGNDVVLATGVMSVL